MVGKHIRTVVKGTSDTKWVEDFHKYYFQCFDEKGNVKACGREKCKELLCFLGDSTYGNANTGVMNVEMIQSLFHSIKKKARPLL